GKGGRSTRTGPRGRRFARFTRRRRLYTQSRRLTTRVCMTAKNLHRFSDLLRNALEWWRGLQSDAAGIGRNLCEVPPEGATGLAAPEGTRTTQRVHPQRRPVPQENMISRQIEETWRRQAEMRRSVCFIQPVFFAIVGPVKHWTDYQASFFA